jgi:hypothetical protein
VKGKLIYEKLSLKVNPPISFKFLKHPKIILPTLISHHTQHTSDLISQSAGMQYALYKAHLPFFTLVYFNVWQKRQILSSYNQQFQTRRKHIHKNKGKRKENTYI